MNWWRRWVPTREQMLASRWLRWLAPWLGHPALWHWSRRGVALGVALGVFFGLLIPLAQIPVAAAAAIVLRANLPAAAASTLITNPVTFGPLYVAAYHLGSWATGDTTRPAVATGPAPTDLSLWERIARLGKPVIVGLSIMAVGAGATTYVLIDLAWRWRVLARRRAKTRARDRAAS